MRVLFIVLLLGASARASEITDAIHNLGAAQFSEREAGIQQLEKLAATDANVVLQDCVRQYQLTADPEVKVRLRSAMQAIVDQYLYRAPRGFLGIRLQGGNIIIGAGGRLIVNGVHVPPEAVWVTGVVENSAAERLGIQPNDFIVAVDDQKMTGTLAFTRYIQSKQPGTKVTLEVLRGESTNAMVAVLGELPKEARDQILTEEGSRAFFKDWLHEQIDRGPTNAPPVIRR